MSGGYRKDARQFPHGFDGRIIFINIFLHLQHLAALSTWFYFAVAIHQNKQIADFVGNQSLLIIKIILILVEQKGKDCVYIRGRILIRIVWRKPKGLLRIIAAR